MSSPSIDPCIVMIMYIIVNRFRKVVYVELPLDGGVDVGDS